MVFDRFSQFVLPYQSVDSALPLLCDPHPDRNILRQAQAVLHHHVLRSFQPLRQLVQLHAHQMASSSLAIVSATTIGIRWNHWLLDLVRIVGPGRPGHGESYRLRPRQFRRDESPSRPSTSDPDPSLAQPD